MYFNIDNRDEAYKAELKSFIEGNYGFCILKMSEHNRGWYGETWRIESDKGNFFVKIIYFKKQAKIYQKSFPVLDFMQRNGIDFVSQPVRTTKNKHFVDFNGGTLAIFKFVDGEHDYDNIPVIVSLMTKIYKLPKPNFEPHVEQFTTDCFDYLKGQLPKLERADKEAYSIVMSNWDLLLDVNEKLKYFSTMCLNMQGTKRFITSGDIGGNTLCQNGKHTIIDWDSISLAPPERDFFWYAKHPEAIDQINAEFVKCGFNYNLNPDIIAYYSYFNYIYFLSETIDALLFNPRSRPEVIKRLNDHFDPNWAHRTRLREIEKNFAFEKEIALICKLTGANPKQVAMNDKGFLSRAYIIDNGRIVFKFPKYDFVKYDNEVFALNFLKQHKFSETLGINFQRINKDWTDTKDYKMLGVFGIIGTTLADLQRNNAKLDIAWIGGKLAWFLTNLRTHKIRTKVGETLEQEIKLDLQLWENRDDRAKELLNKNFTKEQQELLNYLMTTYMPQELSKLGQNLVLSHSDLHEGNILISENGSVGIIDFDNLGYYDEARDFMRMDNDDILNIMLDGCEASETLRRKVEIRRDINRPLTMIARNLFADDYLPKIKQVVTKYKDIKIT